MATSAAHLLCWTVGNVCTIPQAIYADLLELRSWGVGVEALPGVQDHGAGRQQVQGVLGLGCGFCWLLTISLHLHNKVVKMMSRELS